MATYEEIELVCEQPVRIGNPKGDVPQFVACRTKCKKCKDTRHTDLAGRAFAESLCSDHTVALTLTYGSDAGAKSQYLCYPDVQRMLYRLRSDGFKVRYLVAGEYGTKRGRAHWHCVLYFEGVCPEFPPEETQQVHWKYWAKEGGKEPLGFVFVQKPDYHGVRYVVKYATKDEGTGKSTRKVESSLKPPLGATYWSRLAREEIAAYKPFSFEYFLPECRYGNGNPVKFYASRASALLKWKAYESEWNKEFPCSVPPVDSDSYNALLRMLIPAQLRSYCALKNRDIKLPAMSDSYVTSRRFGNLALLKLKTGAIVGIKYHGPNKELSLWHVKSLAEMVALARGRSVKRLKPLPWGVVPF